MSVISHITTSVKQLTSQDQDQMFRLMETYYLGISREKFECDLAEKEEVILLREMPLQDSIVGFSTLMTLTLNIGDLEVKGIFSGDTIVDREARHTLGLGREVTRHFFQAVTDNPGAAIYYILISKGWQTCRIPALLFKEYSPSPGNPIALAHREVMDAFGMKKYPDNYQSQTGIIKHRDRPQRLIPGSTEGTIPHRPDRHIKLFKDRNPDYLMGDELIYVAPVAEWNFTPTFWKLLRC